MFRVTQHQLVAPCVRALSSSTGAQGYAMKLTGDVFASKGARGPGGRSSVAGVTTVVLGATGFVGRYVVNRLGQHGAQVVVPFRGDEHDWRHLKLMGDLGQIVPAPFNPRDPASIREMLVDADYVVNLMGADFETSNWSFEAVNQHLAGAVAEIAADVGVEKLVHVSHMSAAADSPSAYLASKAAGEEAVRKAFPDAIVVKPATVVGLEDKVLNQLGGMAKSFKFLPVVNGGDKIMQPVVSSDVATGIVTALDRTDTAGKDYYLGGPDTLTASQLAHFVFDVIRAEPNVIDVPSKPLEFLGKYTAKLPNTRMSDDTVIRATVDEIIPEGANTFADLNIKPETIESIAIRVLRRFRPAAMWNEPLEDATPDARLFK